MKQIINEGKIYQEFENEVIKGYVPTADIEKGELSLQWKGAPIPSSIISQALSFFIKTDQEHHGEAQLRLFYNKELKQWKAWAFPQESNGMTTKEVENDPDINIDNQSVGKGFKAMGTIHSHCSASAFQSGTDHADEIRQDGIHITIGKIHSKPYDTHARFVFSGIKYDINLVDFLEGEPDWIVHIPESVKRVCLEEYYKNLDPLAYPERWDKNVRKKVWNGYQGSFYNGARSKDDTLKTKKEEAMDDIIDGVSLLHDLKAERIDAIFHLRFCDKRNRSKEEDEIIDMISIELAKEGINQAEFAAYLNNNKYNIDYKLGKDYNNAWDYNQY